MARTRYAYDPDYSVAPGDVLLEHLASRGWSQAEFAKRCGRSGKLISEITSGRAPIEAETALQFERVLGVSAAIWTALEAKYRLGLRRELEGIELRRATRFARRFPVKDLIKLGLLSKSRDEADIIRQLLGFFGVGTVEAYERLYTERAVLYRQSERVSSSVDAINVWLRMGEIQATSQQCPGYDEARFRVSLRAIRRLTRNPPSRYWPEMTRLCNEAGVAFVLVPSLRKTALAGAARWLAPRKALIQQSLRYRSDDHFWFTFFHEAAHLLLHTKAVYIDTEVGSTTPEEREADAFARNWLVPRTAYHAFVAQAEISDKSILGFAAAQGIAPGIVIGMLQHDGHLRWRTTLNRHKQRLVWNGV